MKEIGNSSSQECIRYLNNRAENSRQPFRRREKAMAGFRNMKALQIFASVHATLSNHYNQERHLNNREIFKLKREAALVERRHLVA